MNTKQLLGFISLSIGVILVVFSVRDCSLNTSPKPEVITNSPISPTERLPPPVDVINEEGPKWFWMAVGFALAAAGGAAAIRYRS